MCNAHWHEFFDYATKEAIDDAFRWAANRPSAKKRVKSHTESGSERCLNARELEWLAMYRDRARLDRNGAVVCLEQHPTLHSSENIHKFYLQTLIKTTGLMYSLKHERWMLPVELLLAMGYPVFDDISQYGEWCSFAMPRVAGPRHPPMVAQQAGNTMHVGSIGVALMYGVMVVHDSDLVTTWVRQKHALVKLGLLPLSTNLGRETPYSVDISRTSMVNAIRPRLGRVRE